ncbi:MAG: TlpA family protein disulfide reductase [Firmicutes bacterium]|nr:TlpA family protein disulfide reductase [Bacillota bacterium]
MGFFKRNFFAGVIAGIALTVVVGIGSLALIGYLMIRGGGFDFSPVPTLPEVGNLRSYGEPNASWRVNGLDGKTVRLGDLRGQPVFVNIWASWCGPCVAEMPAIGRLYAELHGQGVAFLVVSEEDVDTVRKFVKRENLAFPVYVSKDGLPPELDSSGIPATFILDGGGRVVFKRIGPAQWDAEPVRNFLLALRSAPLSTVTPDE